MQAIDSAHGPCQPFVLLPHRSHALYLSADTVQVSRPRAIRSCCDPGQVDRPRSLHVLLLVDRATHLPRARTLPEGPNPCFSRAGWVYRERKNTKHYMSSAETSQSGPLPDEPVSASRLPKAGIASHLPSADHDAEPWR